MESDPKKCFAFVFPLASGHLNPSLPVARSLIRLGHQVHYLCFEQMRESIEGTGAMFHATTSYEKELYTGREADAPGALGSLQKELGLEKDTWWLVWQKIRDVQLELQIPGVCRFLQELKPNAVVYCPIINREAAVAADLLRIPSVGLLTFAGPGARFASQMKMCQASGYTLEEVDQQVRDFNPRNAAVQRLQAQYGLHFDEGLTMPFGLMDRIETSCFQLVTTTEGLQDPLPKGLREKYDVDGSRFAYIGPLIDEAGALRAGVHKQSRGEGHGQAVRSLASEGLIQAAVQARAAGRPIVLVSMGTVITGDLKGLGWESRPCGANGQPRGVTGRELCQAAWGGVFDAFGTEVEDSAAPLIIMAVGPQPDPLGTLVVPTNVLCAPSFPQVELLKIGVDVFLTHGGQNSFMEALAYATPLVVCPGFGDQVVNARKAVDLGVALQVDRPDPDAGGELMATRSYRQEVCQALRQVFEGQSVFRAEAEPHAEALRSAGGVPRAVEMLLAVEKCSETQSNRSARAVPACVAAGA